MFIPGYLKREEIIERYETKTGRNLSRIVFFKTFARLKVPVVVQQIYFRYVQGKPMLRVFVTLMDWYDI